MKSKLCQLNVEDACKTYHFTLTEYRLSHQRLNNLGYADDQIKFLLFRPHSQLRSEVMIRLHQPFIDNGFEPQQLVKMFALSGAIHIFTMIAEHLDDLLNRKGFSQAQLTLIFSNHSNSRNYHLIMQYYDHLIALGYNTETLTHELAIPAGYRQLHHMCLEYLILSGVEADFPVAHLSEMGIFAPISADDLNAIEFEHVFDDERTATKGVPTHL